MRSQIRSDPEKGIITRIVIAEWYGIKERALRYRFKQAKICIKNRALTLDDIRLIIKHLGMPCYLPIDVKNLLFVT